MDWFFRSPEPKTQNRLLKYWLWAMVYGLWTVFLPAAGSCYDNSSGSARYISLAPSTTEILFALGLEDEIVGVSSYCNYPPRAAAKARVGDFSHPNLEVISALKPDYIFCTGLEQAPAIERLKDLGFRVYCADPANMEQLLATIKDISLITKKERPGKELIGNIRAAVAAVAVEASAIPASERVRVFLEIWHEPLMTAGRGSFVDELVGLAGGINVAHNVPRPYSNFSAEKVVALDPDCIILAYMDNENALKLLGTRFGWREIKAVKNKRVFNDINPDLLLRPGPRVAEGVRELYKRMYSVRQNGG
ncbi:MAG: cobalamin-binding protein [Candidatus Omnitrophota bacterium]